MQKISIFEIRIAPNLDSGSKDFLDNTVTQYMVRNQYSFLVFLEYLKPRELLVGRLSTHSDLHEMQHSL
jgi:hypothetical protein